MDDKPDFRVKLGDPVQLQFIPEDGRDRLNAKIIGHAINKSLIISAPTSSTGKLCLLRENQHFIVRMLKGNRVFGFESEILKYYTLPFPHAHLSHPRDIECITVRGERRINLAGNLIVLVQAEKSDTAIAASLLNMSNGGALMQCTQGLGQLDDRLAFSVELEISGIQKYLRIPSIIRNISTPQDRAAETGDHIRYGLQFVDLDDDQRFVIAAFVNEQILKQLEE